MHQDFTWAHIFHSSPLSRVSRSSSVIAEENTTPTKASIDGVGLVACSAWGRWLSEECVTDVSRHARVFAVLVEAFTLAESEGEVSWKALAQHEEKEEQANSPSENLSNGEIYQV